jgi:hypothetical protein
MMELTDEQIDEIAEDVIGAGTRLSYEQARKFARALLSASKPAVPAQLRDAPKPLLQWRDLYDSINQVTAALGCHGSISARDDRVLHLMACLKAMDGGEYTPGMMPPKVYYTAPQSSLPAKAGEASTFVIRALVAAGHVSQAKVDEAFAIAAKTPGVTESAPVLDNEGAFAYAPLPEFRQAIDGVHGGSCMTVCFDRGGAYQIPLYVGAASPQSPKGDERAATEAQAPVGHYDGDTEQSRAAFRDYDKRELARTRSAWQIWRDACAWQARAASPQATGLIEQHHRDSAELRHLCAARDEARRTSESLRDMLDDARDELKAIREALGVAYEPHQTLFERMLETARAAAPQAGARSPLDVDELMMKAGWQNSAIRLADLPLVRRVIDLAFAHHHPTGKAEDAQADDARDAARYRWLRAYYTRVVAMTDTSENLDIVAIGEIGDTGESVALDSRIDDLMRSESPKRKVGRPTRESVLADHREMVAVRIDAAMTAAQPESGGDHAD